ncbi:collagen-binding domain-containing protein [Primorskyibacter sp. 2E107]|uniref:collagen-binding domain-containing protein n=1 Tax=Primorskyibacter sp. 2E107 TaxID=3403458 RepID=UPI003AF85DD4
MDTVKKTTAGALLALALGSGGAQAATLSVQESLGTFNLVTQAYSGNQEVEGRTYVGSTLSGVTGQFGFAAPADGAGYAELSVNGDVVNSTINLQTGDTAQISGALVNATVNNGAAVTGASGLPEFDFAAFLAESQALAAYDNTTGTNLSDMNNKKFGGASVVNATLADLASGGYSFDYSHGGTVIVNVSGTIGSFGMNPLGGATDDAPNVLWNFYEATSISVNSVIEGHILAPLATMSGFNGSTEGSVIAAAVNLTNGELHQTAWSGTIPVIENYAPVPLPASGLLLIGAIGALVMRRKTRA